MSRPTKKIVLDKKIHEMLMHLAGGSKHNKAHAASLMASISIGISLYNAVGSQIESKAIDVKAAGPLLELLAGRIKTLQAEFAKLEGIAT